MYVSLFRVDLYIIWLVVSDRHDSTKSCKSLFENPGVFEVHELHGVLVHSSSHHHSLAAHQIIQESPREVFPTLTIWLAQILMRSKKLAEINAPMHLLQVIAIIGRFP
jgi:hypothetical protein